MSRRKRQKNAADQRSGPSGYEQRARDAHDANVATAAAAVEDAEREFQNRPALLEGKRLIVEFVQAWARKMDLTITHMDESGFPDYWIGVEHQRRYVLSFTAANGGFSAEFIAMSRDHSPKNFTAYLVNMGRSRNIAVHDAASLGRALQTRDTDWFLDHGRR